MGRKYDANGVNCETHIPIFIAVSVITFKCRIEMEKHHRHEDNCVGFLRVLRFISRSQKNMPIGGFVMLNCHKCKLIKPICGSSLKYCHKVDYLTKSVVFVCLCPIHKVSFIMTWFTKERTRRTWLACTLPWTQPHYTPLGMYWNA